MCQFGVTDTTYNWDFKAWIPTRNNFAEPKNSTPWKKKTAWSCCPPPASATETTQLSSLIPFAVREQGPTALLPLSLRSQRARPSRSVLPSCHAHWSRTNRPRFPGLFPHWGRHSFPRHAIQEVNKESSCSLPMPSRHVFPRFIHFWDFLFFLEALEKFYLYFKRKFIFSMFFNKSPSLREMPG